MMEATQFWQAMGRLVHQDDQHSCGDVSDVARGSPTLQTTLAGTSAVLGPVAGSDECMQHRI